MLLKRLSYPWSKLHLLWSPETVKLMNPILTECRNHVSIPRAFPSTDVGKEQRETRMKLFDNFLPLILPMFLFRDYQKNLSIGLPPQKGVLSDTETKRHNWVLSWECCSFHIALKQTKKVSLILGFLPIPPFPLSGHTAIQAKPFFL